MACLVCQPLTTGVVHLPPGSCFHNKVIVFYLVTVTGAIRHRRFTGIPIAGNNGVARVKHRAVYDVRRSPVGPAVSTFQWVILPLSGITPAYVVWEQAFCRVRHVIGISLNHHVHVNCSG